MEKFNLRFIKRLVIYPAFFFAASICFGQQNYFQQEVNYKIAVRLDDKQHTLKAQEEIQYINNSDSTLAFIYFHLWPNAYRDRNSALCKQLLELDKPDLYFSKAEERGFIDSLDFKVNSKSVKWEYDKEHQDICKLYLNEPLKPSGTLTITTPFFVKIPDAKFSRLGHIEQAYFITQWYPKPAVFDQNGWHAMPYLDQGEFFSEFGSFDVSITLPKNYVLAATGDRVEAEEEEQFLNNKVIETLGHIDADSRRAETLSLPKSDSVFKTIRFKQSRVHDFAWFADKNYYVLHDQLELPTSKRLVDTWVFFTERNFNKWKKAIHYMNESTLFYSHSLGDYPYNHVTAVDGTIMAGGGMEYPNITVIGDVSSDLELDVTITHEVGHNWLYGILGANERDFPFMDEGINSFYEMRYVRAKYPEKTLAEMIRPNSRTKFFGLNTMPYWKEKELSFMMALKSRTDQILNLPSTQFTPYNYGAVVYSKTPLVLDYLMDYIGEESFDKAMQFYYSQYQFKHPGPKDLFNTLGHFSGTDLKAFEYYFIDSKTQFDYKIKKLSRNPEGNFFIQVKNKSGTPVPFTVQGYKHHKPVGLVWSNGFEDKGTLEFPPADIDYFKIDGEGKLPEINRRNNSIKTKGLFPKAKPFQFNFLSHVDEPDKNQLNYLPVLGANYYNGFMAGLALHNYSLYKKRLEFYAAPMYAFKTKTVSGFAEINLNFFPKQNFQQITLGMKAKSFSYDYFETETVNQNLNTNYNDLYFNYYKLTPFVDLELKKKRPTDKLVQHISYSSALLYADSLISKSIGVNDPPEKQNRFSYVNELNYDLKNTRTLNPLTFIANLQHSGNMAKVSATFIQTITFTKKHFAEIRLFAGSFIAGTTDQKSYYAFRAGGYSGYQDYKFDNNFIARNERSGLGFSQFAEQDGNLKVWTPLGQSATWQAAINIKSPKLFTLPLKVFADAVFCDKAYLSTDPFLWDVGINVTIIKDIIEVYIPIWYCSDIKSALELNKVEKVNTIRFTLNIHKFAPSKAFQNIF